MKTLFLGLTMLCLFFSCKKNSSSDDNGGTTTPTYHFSTGSTIELVPGLFPKDGDTLVVDSEWIGFHFGFVPFEKKADPALQDRYYIILSSNPDFTDTLKNGLGSSPMMHSEPYSTRLQDGKNAVHFLIRAAIQNEESFKHKIYWRWTCANPSGISATHFVYVRVE